MSFLISLGASAWSFQCSYIIQSTKSLEGVIHKAPLNLRGDQVEIANELKQLWKDVAEEGLKANMIAAQTAYVSGRPLKEVVQYFKNFPDTGFIRMGQEHNLIVQTTFFTKKTRSEVLKSFEDVGTSHARYKSDIARIMIMQTALFSRKSEVDVANYFLKAPNTFYSVKSLSHLLIVQTAFLTGKSVKEVENYFKGFPYIRGSFPSGGMQLIYQTVFYAEQDG